MWLDLDGDTDIARLERSRNRIGGRRSAWLRWRWERLELRGIALLDDGLGYRSLAIERLNGRIAVRKLAPIIGAKLSYS